MDYCGVRYSLLVGIEPRRWRIIVYRPGAEPLERVFQGSKLGADRKGRAMIESWLRLCESEPDTPKSSSAVLSKVR